jgi:hypothetical protein
LLTNVTKLGELVLSRTSCFFVRQKCDHNIA